MASPPQWRVPPESILHWREWDGEFVVYHDNSGDTHRLNAIGAAAVKHLERLPLSVPELVSTLAEEFDLTSSPDFSSTIADLVRRLHELGLIEPHP